MNRVHVVISLAVALSIALLLGACQLPAPPPVSSETALAAPDTDAGQPEVADAPEEEPSMEDTDNIVIDIVGAPPSANGIVGGEPTAINVFLKAEGVDAAHFGDPRFFGHQIPAGGHMEIELGGTIERNGVDNDGEFVPIDSNFYLILLAGNAQNAISEAAGEGVQHGNYTISDDGAHTILVTPNGGEGENGLEGERAAQIGLKTLHILPRRGSSEGPAPWTNGPAGSEGTVAVRIYDAGGDLVESGSGTVTFTGPERRHVAAVNFGLTDPGNPFISESVHKDIYAASAYQIVAPHTQLVNTQRGETYAAGAPYALRFMIMEAQEKQPNSFPPFMGIPGVGIVADAYNPSSAKLVQDANGDGVLDDSDESIGSVAIAGPNGETDGSILAPDGWPLTTSGDGVEGPNGSILNVPVEVGETAGYYAVTVSLDGGESATISVIVDEQAAAPSLEEQIANAMSAAPPPISQDATILGFPEGWPGNWPDEPAPEMVELRAGDNGWTCIVARPDTPGNDPMCLNETYLEAIVAQRRLEDAPSTGIGIGYMLQGGGPVGSPPHIMVFTPESNASHATFTQEPGPQPWVMFPDTSYQHLMVLLPPAGEAVDAAEDAIANAMSAGPEALAKDATILGFPEGWPGNWPDEPAPEMVELRSGSNGWTCIVDRPDTPGNDPMCLNETYLEVVVAQRRLEDAPSTGIGFGYMLQGGGPVGSPPHMMVFTPESNASNVAFTREPGPQPWVMFPDTSYQHLMVLAQ